MKTQSTRILSQFLLPLLALQLGCDGVKETAIGTAQVGAVSGVKTFKLSAEQAREALIHLVQDAQDDILRFSLAGLTADPILTEGQNKVLIGPWTIDLEKQTFVFSIVSAPILFFECTGDFQVNESGQWSARVTGTKRT
jgi:hypothetical protein